MKLFTTLALLALPLAAEPIFDLYDCTGREVQCTGLFPGTAARPDGGSWWESPYTVGDRVIVNGIDLGPSAMFTAFFYRDPWVIGWSYSNRSEDEDGELIRWLLEDGTATLLGSALYSYNPHSAMLDVNSSGQLVGKQYDVPHLFPGGVSLDMIEDGETWRARIVNFDDRPTEFLRINDAGQVLGFTDFWGAPGEEPATRMILLSPLDVPFGTPPSGTPSPTPEPGTWLLLGFGLLACVGAKRFRR